MANILNYQPDIQTGLIIEASHVSQSVDAFTGTEAYDITISGSLTVTGSTNIKDILNVNGITTLKNTFNSSGSINLTGSINTSGSTTISGSLFIKGINNTPQSDILTINSSTGQVYYTSSNTFTPSVAPSDTFIQYNSGSKFSATSSFKFIYTLNSFEQGDNIKTSGLYSHAQGYQTTASNNYSHAEGNRTISSGLYSHAEGQFTIANGNSSHAEGYNTQTIGNYSHAEGLNVTASGDYSHAEGNSNRAIGTYSHAEGSFTSADGLSSHTEGSGSLASGIASHAEGFRTTASFNYAHAEGATNLASGFASHAEGLNSIATGSYSHAEGNANIAFGFGSHAEGHLTLASGVSSHAEGLSVTASGDYSHAEGHLTLAQGLYSHAEGYQNKAIGTYSHAGGAFSTANGYGSFALGGGVLTAQGNPGVHQFAVGLYNSTSSGFSFVVGNGSDFASPSNAFRVSSSGECFAGSTFTNGGADYAEYFESYNGQSIPLGTIVELTGSYIKICETTENAIGVISNKPSILGNSDEGTGDEWVGKYEKDVWGNYIMEEYQQEFVVGLDNDNNEIVDTYTFSKRKTNPEYNSSIEYTPRSERPEWNVVGLLGQIKVLKNQPVPSRWIKMKDIDNNIALYLVR